MEAQESATTLVAVAKLKQKDASGKLVYLPGTRSFPIKGKPSELNRAISMFVGRMLRRSDSKYAKPDVYCFIESPTGELLKTFLGRHEISKTHKSKYRLVHIVGGKVVKTIWSTAESELDDEHAPWDLVNQYRPQRKKGYCAVYEGTATIVIRRGERLAWSDGKRKP